MYGVVGSKTYKITKPYAVIGSVTKKISKIYGVVGGVTKLIFDYSTANTVYIALRNVLSFAISSDLKSWTQTINSPSSWSPAMNNPRATETRCFVEDGKYFFAYSYYYLAYTEDGLSYKVLNHSSLNSDCEYHYVKKYNNKYYMLGYDTSTSSDTSESRANYIEIYSATTLDSSWTLVTRKQVDYISSRNYHDILSCQVLDEYPDYFMLIYNYYIPNTSPAQDYTRAMFFKVDGSTPASGTSISSLSFTRAEYPTTRFKFISNNLYLCAIYSSKMYKLTITPPTASYSAYKPVLEAVSLGSTITMIYSPEVCRGYLCLYCNHSSYGGCILISKTKNDVPITLSGYNIVKITDYGSGDLKSVNDRLLFSSSKYVSTNNYNNFLIEIIFSYDSSGNFSSSIVELDNNINGLEYMDIVYLE